MRLKDKVAIVTGAGSGFGAGIARRFAQVGAKLVVNDINAEGGTRVAKETGGEFVQADVTRAGDWAKLVAAATAKFGRLDCVVNNAGWTHRNKPYLEVTETEFDKVYAVNVKSIYLSALHALPVMRKQGGGLRQHRLHRRAAPARGPDGLQQVQGWRDPDVQVDARRVRAGQGSSVSPWLTVSPMFRRLSMPAWMWMRSLPDYHSSSIATSTFSRKLPSLERHGASGGRSCERGLEPKTHAPGCFASTLKLRDAASPNSSRIITSCGQPWKPWRQPWEVLNRCTLTLSTKPMLRLLNKQ